MDIQSKLLALIWKKKKKGKQSKTWRHNFNY